MSKLLTPTKTANFVRKEHRPLIKNAIEHGFTFEKTSKHIKVFLDGKAITTMPLTPSDHRSMRNNVSYIKRITGIDIRNPPIKEKKDVTMPQAIQLPANQSVKAFTCLSCGQDERFETVGERIRHYRESHDTPSDAFRYWIAHDSAGVTFTPMQVCIGAKKYASTATQEISSFNANNASAVIGALVHKGAVIKESRGHFRLVDESLMHRSPPTEVPALDTVADTEKMEQHVPQQLVDQQGTDDTPHLVEDTERELGTDIEESFAVFFSALRSNDTHDPHYWEAVADIARSYLSIVEPQF